VGTKEMNIDHPVPAKIVTYLRTANLEGIQFVGWGSVILTETSLIFFDLSNVAVVLKI
jgi:hypothetical protein